MDDMRQFVLDSYKDAGPGDKIQRRPFRLDPAFNEQPSRFEVDLILHGVRHEYGFVLDDTEVIEEWAIWYPRGRPATLFRRHYKDVEFGESSHRTDSRAVIKIMRSNALYLSAAAAAEHAGLTPLYDWFRSNLGLAEASSRESRWAHTAHLLGHPETHEKVLSLLRAADLGITDVRMDTLDDPKLIEKLRRVAAIFAEDDDHVVEDLPPEVIVGVKLSHLGTAGSVELDTLEESLGTLVWFGLVGPVVDALTTGSVLLADELESSLHPTLVTRLVQVFQDPRSNPNGAQLIFNSYIVTLLGDSVHGRSLGRDQVWFTEKMPDGSTRLYALAELSPRKDEAIGRRYLEGRYGASPIIDDAELSAIADASADWLKK
jgi:hypothetical protein